MFCCLATSLHPLFLVRPHWKQINEHSSHFKRRPKGKKNEIGAKRLREERCSHSSSGPIHGGFCLSEQFQTSGEPSLWTLAPKFDNLVLRVVVFEFFMHFFFLGVLSQNVSGKNFPFSIINSQFRSALITVLRCFSISLSPSHTHCSAVSEPMKGESNMRNRISEYRPYGLYI